MFSGLYEQVKTSFVNLKMSKEDITYPDSSKIPAFQEYRERAIIGLQGQDLKGRQETQQTALKPANTYGKLQTGVREVLKGNTEHYDFCTELLDSTPGPFPLECLQNEFIRQGGQATGTAYPSQANLKVWNSLKKWLHVKEEIQKLITRTLSNSPQQKEEGVKLFYGVGLQKEIVSDSPEPGVEIFWFTHHTDITKPTTFLGRRIRPMIPSMNMPTHEPGSAVFFTSVVANRRAPCQYRVTSFNGFSLYFNSPMTKVYNNKMVTDIHEVASLHNGGTAAVNSPLINLTEDVNKLSGYLYYEKGTAYYKLEAQSEEFGPGWGEIPRTNLQLIQEPFAPMISFEIQQSPGIYGCDYPFCDKRMGGFKMKWEQEGWGGPSLQYRGESLDQQTFPLKKHFFSFPSSKSAIKSKFSFRLSSFMTLTMLITMRSCPKSGQIAMPLTLWGKAGGSPSLLVRGISGSEATINLCSFDGSLQTRDGPVIQKGVPTLIVLRILRKNEMDPSSIESLQIGLANVSELQKSTETRKVLRQSSPLVLPGLTSDEPAYFRIQSENMAFDLFWIHLFDYKLEDGNLYREARADWGYLP